MKSKFKRVAATALAMSMCVPAVAFAANETGSFDTSFDVYSPALHISVPLSADVRINPLAKTGDSGVAQFTVASNSIDIINASVDTEADAAIPVNVTVNATITKKADGVISEYNTFTADSTSTKKKINLNLTEAATAAILDEDNRAADGTDAKLLDLASVPVKTAAVYTSASNKTAITKYGSLLSMNIAAPTTEDTTNNSYTTDPTKVKPAVGSFAVTGVANTNADWKADDIAVSITYNVKASNPVTITTPTVAGATGTGSAADVTITVPGVGEATVMAAALHNDESKYVDFMLEGLEIAYVDNSGATDATIKIPAEHATLKYLADEANGCKGEAQDLIIGLSDGRMVVSTITIN